MAETETVSRSQTWKHQAMLDWLIENGHTTKGANQVATLSAAFANRAAWRKSPTYRNLVSTHKGAAAEARAERTAARAAERATKAEATAKAKAAQKAAAPKATTKAAPAKATKTATKTATKAPAKKASPKSAKAESPFD